MHIDTPHNTNVIIRINAKKRAKKLVGWVFGSPRYGELLPGFTLQLQGLQPHHFEGVAVHYEVRLVQLLDRVVHIVSKPVSRADVAGLTFHVVGVIFDAF